MKLDFETNTSTLSSAVKEFYNDSDLENSPAKASKMLAAGIKAAEEGRRSEAKLLLLGVTNLEPGNEEAWMRLASASEYPEELLGFLDHVLEINPHNERALEWSKSTKAVLCKNFVERGINASKEAHKEFARQCFLQAIAQDDENETAWLWLASVTDSAEEKNAHLQKVLSINPKNENAIVLLKSIKNQKVDALLQNAVGAAVAGKSGAAKQMLEEVLSTVPELVEALILKSFLVESFEEKISCFEKILDIDDENELANVNWTSLLDIMSRAESTRQPASLRQLSDDAENVSEESKTSFDSTEDFDSPEKNESFDYDTASLVEDFEALDSNFAAQPLEKETFDEKALNEINFREEDNEEDLTDLRRETSSIENKVFGEKAQDFSDYSEIESESSQGFSENHSPNFEDEELPVHDNLPSYYGSEEITASYLPAESDFPEESTEPAQSVFVTDESEAEEHRVFDEEAINEEIVDETDSDKAVFFDESFNEPLVEMQNCPFCDAVGESHSLVCDSCHAMLTLSDLEMLLAHQEADREILKLAVKRLEDDRNRRDFNAEELKVLALAEINLKNLRQGYVYLEEAAQMNSNDVFLASQVNFLKIRLAEIEEQLSAYDAMPKNRKILVVDDSATVRKLISGKLEKSGHEVFCAVDGVDALEKIKESLPDLILLDINMPRMDGYQVCKLIRSDEATKDIPVVMISGKDGFFDKVRGRMAGTTGYITKPFGPETLMKMLETYIV